jgi:hypothetical protein
MAVRSIAPSREDELAAQLAAVTRERDAYRASYNAVVALLYNPEHRGTRAAVIHAVTLAAFKHHQRHPSDTAAPIYLPKLAAAVHTADASVSRKLSELHERRLVRLSHQTERTSDNQPRRHLYVTIPGIAHGLAAAIQTMADYQAPPPPSRAKVKKRNWGGERPCCPDHPDAAIIEQRTLTRICSECGVVIEYQEPTPAHPYAKSFSIYDDLTRQQLSTLDSYDKSDE